jgi:hypothetical protein
MSRLEIMRGAFTDCFRSPRLWLIQFFANVILFALLVAWLLVPVASNLHVVFNFVFAALLLVATLTLYSGTLNACLDRLRGASAPLWPAFRRALRHILPVAICIAAFCFLWLLVNALGSFQTAFPPYVRSTLPVSLRRNISLHALDNLFSAALFVARWVLAPGLLLPLLLQTSDLGFRGFARHGLSAWRKTIFNFSYWLTLLVAALVGVLATQKLMAATPDFKTSTFHGEVLSFAARLVVAYLLGLFSWILTCSVVSRGAAADGISTDVPGNPAA